MGIYPESFMAPMRKDVETLMARIERAAPAGDAQLEKGEGMPKDAHGKQAGHGAAPAHAPGEAKHAPTPDMHIAPPAGEAEVH
jgi:NADH-quinone oxidoreductase subunit M